MLKDRKESKLTTAEKLVLCKRRGQVRSNPVRSQKRQDNKATKADKETKESMSPEDAIFGGRVKAKDSN
jgi:hypothetical protein